VDMRVTGTDSNGAAPAYRSRRGIPAFGNGFFILPGLLFLAAVFVVPLLGIVMRSFDPSGRLSFVAPVFSLSNYRDLLQDPAYLIILRNTFVVAFIATAITLLLAYPTCYLMSRVPARWGRALLILALFPFWTSILVRLYAFTQILPWFGVMYTTTATIIGMVYYLLPYMIAVLYANMARIDGELLLAARTLGASNLQSLRLVFVPLAHPGTLLGTMLIFVISIGFFLTPALLGGGSDLTIATYIQQQVNLVNWRAASPMGTVLLAIVIVLLILGSLLKPRRPATLAMMGQKGVARDEPLRFTATTIAALAWTVTVFLFLLGPLVIVVLVSFTPATYLRFPPSGVSLRWYADFLHNSEWLSAAWLSLRVACLSAAAATLLGLLTAIGLERSRVAGKALISAAFMAPVIVPVILIAVGFYDIANRLRVAGTVGGYVAAHTLLALPIAVMIISNALRSTGAELELVARTLGAVPRRAFSAITIPSIAPSLVVAAVFSFVTSWDEPVMSLFLSTGRNTLPVEIFNSMQTEVQPTVAAISSLMMVTMILIAVLLNAAGRITRARFSYPVIGDGT
jgi:putative spermidine/putrescine transport system permease protein